MVHQNNRNGGQPRPQPSSKTEETARPLPQFDITKLTKDLFDETAHKCAKAISEASKTQNMSTQIRKFYDELVIWEERGSVSDEKFQEVLPFVYMMKSKVAYAKGRKHVDETFQKYFDTLINQINDRKTLKNAKLFMEAMMGYYKQYRAN